MTNNMFANIWLKASYRSFWHLVQLTVNISYESWGPYLSIFLVLVLQSCPMQPHSTVSNWEAAPTGNSVVWQLVLHRSSWFLIARLKHRSIGWWKKHQTIWVQEQLRQRSRRSPGNATRVGQSRSIGKLSRLILHPILSCSTHLMLLC